MVWVPAGSFTFGDTVYPEEQPVRPVSVQGFWMDRTEVTNAQFAAFVAATGYVTTAERTVDTRLHPGLPLDMQQPGAVVFVSPADLRGGGDVRQWWQYIPGAQWRHPGGPSTTLQGLDALPVVAVTAEDAQAYARWRGGQLPTEPEWEWAALGGQLRSTVDTVQPEEANTWQGFFPLSNQAKDGFERAAPVGCFQANGYGLFDMIGNVWELTADRYTESHSPQNNVPPDQPPAAQRPGAPSGRHVIKGGSFLCAPNYCMRYRAAARQPQEDDLASSHVGFRTVLHAPGP
jgi:formylglycine-generating enzyme required for sulfatase activity